MMNQAHQLFTENAFKYYNIVILKFLNYVYLLDFVKSTFSIDLCILFVFIFFFTVNLEAFSP